MRSCVRADLTSLLALDREKPKRGELMHRQVDSELVKPSLEGGVEAELIDELLIAFPVDRLAVLS